MKQFHWGYAIIIFFICYISYLVWTVVASRQVNHSLVLDDYYALDLAYQDHYFAASNALNADLQPTIHYDEELQQVVVDFKEVMISDGTVQLYRPSDSEMDEYYELEEPDTTNKFVLDVSLLNNGKWIAKTQWTQGNRKYYQEDIVLISEP